MVSIVPLTFTALSPLNHGARLARARRLGGRMRLALLAAGLLAALVVLVSAFGLDEGEVVTLQTSNAAGASYDTSVWVIEDAGSLYLRAGRGDATWLARLRERPEIRIERHGERLAFLAVPLDDPAARERVNAAMAAKYGAADRILGRFVDLSRSVPIRLDPSATTTAAPTTPSHP